MLLEYFVGNGVGVLLLALLLTGAKCGLPQSAHSRLHDGKRISCEAAICAPLLTAHTNSYSYLRHGPTVAYAQRVCRILDHCPPALVGKVTSAMQAAGVPKHLAQARLNPEVRPFVPMHCDHPYNIFLL